MAAPKKQFTASDFFKPMIGTYDFKIDETIRVARKQIIRGFDAKLVSMGSCFASNVPTRMQPMGFKNAFFDIVVCRHFSSETLAHRLKTLAESLPGTLPEEQILFYENKDALGGFNPYQFVHFRSYLEKEDIANGLRRRSAALKDRLSDCEHG